MPLHERDVPRPAEGLGAARLGAPTDGAKHGAGQEAARIELLERRLVKLSRLLDERTAQLQLRMDSQASEQGVASLALEGFGLRGDSEEVARKRDLMSAIFVANRKLRERVGSGRADAE